ncbi:inositol-trisphosphate 3-kinase homolog isoform X2 [Trichogramma pretiosum]|uniref:inositol-trisphosphate 3-kinase homolog isoform X2 n=1 Tax=Trichogramma pretiosum TaxID=7493 RepID=UPI0006C9687C|nr:inositol-trisphosphate 3-kinase homolog isoform X2 [Trichogramma pretiosum]
MSSSVCHAPLPARMEAFTTRMCLTAVDQYQRLLQFNKSLNSRDRKTVNPKNAPAGKKTSSTTSASATAATPAAATTVTASPATKRRLRDLAVNSHTVFRPWRRHHSDNASKSMKNANNRSLPNFPNAAALDGDRVTAKTTTTAKTLQVDSKANGQDENRSNNCQAPQVARTSSKKWPPSYLYGGQDAIKSEDESLKALAINALDLTAPASDLLLKNRLKSWFQLSGHPGGFAPAGPGTVWKRRVDVNDDTERKVYEALKNDPALKDCIPRFQGEVEFGGHIFLELQDLLFGFDEPHVVDIKLGTRTFLESEVSKTQARSDLYEKMISVDPNAPTPEEHEAKAVTKLRYMQFREQQSSTCSHGFRIEALKLPDSPPITDLKKVKSHADVLSTMQQFIGGRKDNREKLIAKLKHIRNQIEQSDYFKTHEVIGSSIFMIHDSKKVGAWLIDFAKTRQVPLGCRLDHRTPWQNGNHEEGLLFGLDKLIATLEEVKC